MKRRKEAISWAITILIATLTAFGVIQFSTLLAFASPGLSPLEAVSMRFRIADYSADAADAPRLPALEVAVLAEAAKENEALNRTNDPQPELDLPDSASIQPFAGVITSLLALPTEIPTPVAQHLPSATSPTSPVCTDTGCLTPTPTARGATVTPTPTSTPTASPTYTFTAPAFNSPTATPSSSLGTATSTGPAAPCCTPTATPTASRTMLGTMTGTLARTTTMTSTPSRTTALTKTSTPSRTMTPTMVVTASRTPTPTKTALVATPTDLPASATPTRTLTKTRTATVTPTPVPPTATASATFEPSSASTGLRINFQPAGAAVPEGYLVDSGEDYGNRSDGLKYGWSSGNNTAVDRDSALSPDQRFDTLIEIRKDWLKWEIKLPNGLYTVHVVAGDPCCAHGVDGYDAYYAIKVENVTVISGKPTDTQRWLEGVTQVTVWDGRLTVRNGSGAHDNRINFIEIFAGDQMPTLTPPPSATATAEPSRTPSWTPTPEATSTPSATPTSTVTLLPTVTPSPTPTASATHTETPSPTPTNTPTQWTVGTLPATDTPTPTTTSFAPLSLPATDTPTTTSFAP